MRLGGGPGGLVRGVLIGERRGDRVVGRISAQVDDLVQVHMEPGTGQWGMFEALDGEAAAALAWRAAEEFRDNPLQGIGCFGTVSSEGCGILHP